MSWTRSTGMEKIGKYCAYQERCHAEVRRKLREMGCPYEEAEEVLVELIEMGFVSEERFARSFARGRFRQKQWGRMLIRKALREKQVGEHLVALAMEEEINAEAYWETLLAVARKRISAKGMPTDWTDRQKLKAYLVGRGYEYDLVDDAIAELVPDR